TRPHKCRESSDAPCRQAGRRDRSEMPMRHKVPDGGSAPSCNSVALRHHDDSPRNECLFHWWLSDTTRTIPPSTKLQAEWACAFGSRVLASKFLKPAV